MMQGKLHGVTALLGLVMFLSSGVAEAKDPGPAMPVIGPASPPVGYVAFCRDVPSQCVPRGSRRAEVLTPERWQELEVANLLGNFLISPRTDLDQHQTEEVWSLPEAYGDCEDFVLWKRRWLVERGWPTGALLITVVLDEHDEGHAVLVARTDRGDFVLDNQTSSIKPWYRTPYRFVKRQSSSDPDRWVRVGNRGHQPLTASMGVD